MKPYKACPPSETIEKIRNSLNEVGIFLQESTFRCNDNFFTTRVSIGGDLSLLDIGANGKGVTYEYALASGYAEFMERLQNNMLFKGFKNAKEDVINNIEDCLYKERLLKLGLQLDFLYDPNELSLSVEAFVNDMFWLLKKIFPFLEDKNSALFFLRETLSFEEIICIPFYSEKDRKEVFLPIELIQISCGSNGMASGNTKEEALIQGFCEIFERYAMSQIYYNNITPPTIPLEEFKEYPIYDVVKRLQENNDYLLIIKDCSLDLNIPVLGVLVIDVRNGKYNFNLGSALNPGVALERCLTELHQSSEGLKWHDIMFEKYNNNPRYSEEYVFINGNRLFTDGSGDWPISLFEEKPSYEYKGLNRNLDLTDREDLVFIKKLIKGMGFDIYIRDVTFLNLNTYHIVVPGMSQVSLKLSHYTVLNDTLDKLRLLRGVKNLDVEQLKDLCNYINRDYLLLKKLKFDINEMLVFHKNVNILDLTLEQIFFMLNYAAGNIKEAYEYLLKFLENKDFFAYKYYYGVKDYVKLKSEGYDDEEITNSLNILYGDELVEIVEDVKDPQNIMQYFNWSNDFKCEKCSLIDDCCQFKILGLIKKIQDKHSKAKINHNCFDF